MLIDSHAHIDSEAFDADRKEVLARARQAGVKRIVSIALGPEREQFARTYALAAQTDGMFLTVGIHPHEAKGMNDESLSILESFIQREKVVAVGEIGLDYHYHNSPRDDQVKCFSRLLEFACEKEKPVVIHSRNAFSYTFRLTQERDIFRRVGGVLHCFTGNAKEAEAYVKLGAYISFSGIVTFEKAKELQEAARVVPMERMLIETDAPYLAPEPYRGKRNEPAYVVHVAEKIAQIKRVSTEEVAHMTSQNTTKLFGF